MTDPREATDEALVRGLVEDRIPALRAKDAGRLLEPYAPEVVNFDLAPPLRYVAAAAQDRQAMEAWLATWDGGIACELRDLSVTVEGGLAFCHGLQRLRGTKVGGETPDLWVRLTVCLRRAGGRWQIAHEHMSVPFHMDGSYRAAVDLEP